MSATKDKKDYANFGRCSTVRRLGGREMRRCICDGHVAATVAHSLRDNKPFGFWWAQDMKNKNDNEAGGEEADHDHELQPPAEDYAGDCDDGHGSEEQPHPHSCHIHTPQSTTPTSSPSFIFDWNTCIGFGVDADSLVRMLIKRRQRWHQEAKEEAEAERRAICSSRGYRHQEALEAAAREARLTSASSPHTSFDGRW